MKLLIFAHKPPPRHGQSMMVQLALDVLSEETSRGDFDLYHIDARLSEEVNQISRASLAKVFRLLNYCLQALWCRIRDGVTTLYFVPAHADRVSIARDWMVMALCRPFFRTVVYHWHAAGLGEWLDREARWWERGLTRLLLGRPDLSIVLREYNRRDATAVGSRRTIIVPNGIPDPCPSFETEVAPRRRARAAARRRLAARQTVTAEERAQAGGDPEVFRVLFLGLCCRAKGLFDALEAISLAAPALVEQGFRLELMVAGKFLSRDEETAFESRRKQVNSGNASARVQYRGFVTGTGKEELFVSSDCFCFPTYYRAESFGLVLLEAMAFGLPLLTTRWRELPELLPPGYPGVVDAQAPDQMAEQFLRMIRAETVPGLRDHFLAHYTKEVFARNLRAALATLS
jgi:glycosyltransferase involved in cell wall biosynthesis